MLPPIALALAVEKLRDGGSLCASFQASNGLEYWLVFPVQLECGVLKGYASPVIIERPFATQKIPVSWLHAKIILGQIERMLPLSKDRQWVQIMHEAIRTEGKLSTHSKAKFKLQTQQPCL